MASSYTTNKVLEKPANGDYVDTWNVPANGDFDIIDQAFGGTTSLNATGGSAVLTATQYRSLILSISGAISANVTYTIPSGKGGQWIIYNSTTDATTGPWTVTIASGGGGTSVVIDRNRPVGVYCDGTNVKVFAGAGSVTSVDVSGGSTGLTTSGGPVTTAGTITLGGTLAASNGGTGLTSPGTAGNVLTSTGTGWVSSAVLSSLSTMQVFSSSGTFTVPAGVKIIKVTVVGAGGGGGGVTGNYASPGGGGGGGGAAIKTISGVTPGDTVTVTVGVGGIAGTAGDGTDGGSSSFGSYCSATGGGAGLGTTIYANNGGVGGIGTNGDLNIGGGGGGAGISYVRNIAGAGGNSIFGGGGAGVATPGILYTTANPGQAYGGGGGGGVGAGGAGANGVVIVEY